MVKTNPTRIPGRWREGFALDYQTISSTYIGDDEFGHPLFDTRRTELGELLYRLKYKSDESTVEELADAAARFVRSWNQEMALIVPVPPSRSNRPFQPVIALATSLSERLAIPVRTDCVVRVKELPEMKDVYDYDTRLKLLQGAHQVAQTLVEAKKVLLFDDLFRSGATMNAITNDLYEKGKAAEVFALTITRTRSKS
jgi:predicted amidophosphoribosyltransferase